MELIALAGRYVGYLMLVDIRKLGGDHSRIKYDEDYY